MAAPCLWVVSLVSCGYWFGNIAFVRENFTLVIFAIIAISLLPVVIEVLRERSRGNHGARPQR